MGRQDKRQKKAQSPSEYASAYGQLVKAAEKQEPLEKEENWYATFCRKAGSIIKGKPKFARESYQAALDFLGWDLSPSQVNAAPLFMFLISFFPSILLLTYLLLFSRLDILVTMYVAPFLVLVPFALTMWIQHYPISAADAAKMRSITHIPEIINYLVMSMKLTPNLERAVEFAGEHGRGKIAEDLRRLVWDVRVGNFRTMEEGLDALAYKWGKFSDEFKHALMLVRSCVIEVDDSKRAAILDKAVSDTLEGIREDMDRYAKEMRQPSIYLYYFGVLLPLMLIIMLPVGSVMASLPLAQTWLLILLYDIITPVGTIYFAKTILKKRPPVYVPPKIPDSYPGLPPKNHLLFGKTPIPAAVAAAAAGIAVFAAFYMFLEPALNPLPPAWDLAAQKAHFSFFTIAGAVLGASFAASVYLYGTAWAKRRAQREVVSMEGEFQDSLYIVASRLGENRPIEEAMAYSADFLAGTKIASLFRNVVDNIRNLGMTVEMALFDPIYGALKDTPSDLIRGSMKIVVSSIGLGVQQGARALVSLSLQLRDAYKLRQEIASMLGEITSMMKSIAFLIAPIVLGITAGLQKIIISALKSVSAINAPALPAGLNLPVAVPQLFSGANTLTEGGFFGVPDPLTFLLIIAAYVVEITVILIYFTSKIEEGDNDLAFKISLAKSLPIAMLLFFASSWVAIGMSSVAG